MEKGFDIEIHYNGVNKHDLKTDMNKGICQSIGQQVFNKLRPFADEIDSYGGIGLNITNDNNGVHVSMKYDWKKLPQELIDRIGKYIKENPEPSL